MPGLKTRTMEDSCGTDVERRSSRPGMPFMASSIGTVTSDSTSDVDRPRLSVWISTCGGANSGNTSTGAERMEPMPNAIIATAAAITRNR